MSLIKKQKLLTYILSLPVENTKMKKTILLFILTLLCLTTTAKASPSSYITLSDKAEVSLLTSTPWNGAIYALFGHTAIRVKDTIEVRELGLKKLDIVFNYGLFSFNTPNFMYRFVKGETDYIVGYVGFDDYLYEYKERGVGVFEQQLNIDQTEKQKILDALIINSLPENRTYRYNYFYDNCATRPRDIIEKNISGKIKYTPTVKEQSYRDLVWECTSAQPWARFGIDLVIGADADKKITDRQKDFLPLYLMGAYEGAIIEGDTINRILVESTNTLLTPVQEQLTYTNPQADNIQKATDWPLIVGCILFLFTLLLSLLIYNQQLYALGKVFDTILFFIAGLGGCIIFFLMFFSEHPCTNPNWNIMWLNPLQLLIIPLFFAKKLSKYVYYYHFINFASLSLFLLAWCLIPQQLEIAFIPYILTIGTRSIMNILQYKKINKKADYSLPRVR